MGSDDKLAKRDLPSSDLAQQREQVDLEARRKGIEAAAKVVDLIVHGGHVFLNAHAAQVEMTKARQATEDAISLLDAQTTAELRKLERSLHGERDKTERLRIIADVAAKQVNVNPVLAEAFAHVLRSTFPSP